MPDDFVVDQLFPANEHHLIFGPSGAGSTTLLLQILAEWRASKPILDIPEFIPHPAPFCFVSCAKSVAATRRHMRRLGLDPRQIPLVALASRPQRPEDHTFPAVLTAAMERVPDLKVIFLDGLAMLCDKLSDDRTVAHFMGAINEVCGRMNITLISTIRSAKARTGEGYVSLRERIVGSGAFASQSDTKIGIEPVKPSEPLNASRSVFLLMQDQEPQAMRFTVTEFGLIPSTPSTKTTVLDTWLSTVNKGTTITTGELVEMASKVDYSRASVYRWLADQVELGTLRKVRHGVYQIPEPYRLSIINGETRQS